MAQKAPRRLSDLIKEKQPARAPAAAPRSTTTTTTPARATRSGELTAADLDHELFAQATRRRLAANAPEPPTPPNVPLMDRALGSLGAAGRELRGMPQAMADSASFLAFNPLNPEYGARKLAETGEATEEMFQGMGDSPIDYAIENPITTLGLASTPFGVRAAMKGMPPRGVPPPTPPVRPGPRMLPPGPALDLPSGGVMARGANLGEFGGMEPPRTATVTPTPPGVSPRYQTPPPPEVGGLPAVVPRERMGRPLTEWADQPIRPGFPPERVALPPPPRQITAGTEAPRQPLLPPGPGLELPEGRGTVPRGGNVGTPGGLGPARQSTVTPTRAGTSPQYGQPKRLSDLIAEKSKVTAPDPKPAAPTTPQGTVRLYRAEPIPGTGKGLPDWVQAGRAEVGADAATGRWFTNDPEKLRWYIDDVGENVQVRMIEISAEDAAKYNVQKHPAALRYSRDPESEFFLPSDMAARAASRTPAAAKPPTGGLLGRAEPLEVRGGPSAPLMGATEVEARTIAARGRRPELLKPTQGFDTQKIIDSPLFQGRGGPQQFLGIDERAAAPRAVEPSSPYAVAVEETAVQRLQEHASTADPNAQSLVEFIRDKGGVKDVGGDLASREANKQTPKGKRVLIQNKTGLDLDRARELATEAGYLDEGSTVADLLDSIDQELRGQPVYSRQTEGVPLKAPGTPLANFPESPQTIAKAIVKDADNPLYLRVKDAFKQAVEKTEGEQIAAAVDEGDTSFNFGDEKGAVAGELLRHPLRTMRQAAHQMGENVGGKIVDTIAAAFDKYAPEVVRRNLGMGEFDRPESYKTIRRERRGEIAEVHENVEGIRDQLLESIPDEQSRLLAKRIATNEATPAEIVEATKNPNIQAAAELVRNEFMNLAQAIVTEGVHQYAKIDQATRQKIVAAMRGEGFADMPPGTEQFATTGVAKYYGEYLPRLYKHHDAPGILRKHGISKDRIRIELNRLKQRNEALSPEVRKALGEIEELVEPAVRGIFEENRMLVNNRFFQKIARDPFLTASDPKNAPTSWKTLPETDRLGPLSGKTVQASVFRDLTEMIKAPEEALRIVRTINRWVKKGKTVWNPATHIRNYESNWITRDALAGMDITTQAYRDVKALRAIRAKNELFKEARHHGLFDTDYGAFDLSGLRMEEAPTVIRPGMSGAFETMDKVFEMIHKADDTAGLLYRLEDDIPKLAMYDWLRTEMKMTPAQAVAKVLNTLPDYSEVAPWVEKAQRHPLGPTFLSYQAQMTPRFARAIIKHPIRAGKYVVMGALVAEALVELGLKDADEMEAESKELPQYMKPQLGGVVRPFVPLPWKDRAGRSLYFDTTYTLPFGNLMDQSGFLNLPPVFDLGILPGTLLDVLQNRNAYATYLRGTHTPIWDSTDPVRNVGLGAEYVGQQLLPSLTPGFGYGAQRLQSAAQQTPSYYGEAAQDLPLAAAQVIGGQKTVAIDAGMEGFKRARDFERKLRDLRSRIGGVARAQNITPEARDQEINRLQREISGLVDAYQNR